METYVWREKKIIDLLLLLLCSTRREWGTLDFLSQITHPLPFQDDRISFPYHKNTHNALLLLLLLSPMDLVFLIVFVAIQHSSRACFDLECIALFIELTWAQCDHFYDLPCNVNNINMASYFASCISIYTIYTYIFLFCSFPEWTLNDSTERKTFQRSRCVFSVCACVFSPVKQAQLV